MKRNIIALYVIGIMTALCLVGCAQPETNHPTQTVEYEGVEFQVPEGNIDKEEGASTIDFKLPDWYKMYPAEDNEDIFIEWSFHEASGDSLDSAILSSNFPVNQPQTSDATSTIPSTTATYLLSENFKVDGKMGLLMKVHTESVDNDRFVYIMRIVTNNGYVNLSLYAPTEDDLNKYSYIIDTAKKTLKFA